jgi:hypothetical protein
MLDRRIAVHEEMLSNLNMSVQRGVGSTEVYEAAVDASQNLELIPQLDTSADTGPPHRRYRAHATTAAPGSSPAGLDAS